MFGCFAACMSVCHMPYACIPDAQRSQKEGIRSSPELDGWWAVMWVLVIEPSSSARAVGALNYWGISPAPELFLNGGGRWFGATWVLSFMCSLLKMCLWVSMQGLFIKCLLTYWNIGNRVNCFQEEIHMALLYGVTVLSVAQWAVLTPSFFGL